MSQAHVENQVEPAAVRVAIREAQRLRDARHVGTLHSRSRAERQLTERILSVYCPQDRDGLAHGLHPDEDRTFCGRPTQAEGEWLRNAAYVEPNCPACQDQMGAEGHFDLVEIPTEGRELARKFHHAGRSGPYVSGVTLLFDIETTGLDFEADRLRAFGALAPEDGSLWLQTTSGSPLVSERRLIRDLLVVLGEHDAWCGWNLTEFDLPFLAARAAVHGIEFPLVAVSDEPKIGKYGRPRFTSPEKPVRDLAYENKEVSEALGVQWSLQPLARSYGWRPLVSLTGADMPDAPMAQVAAHCLDDLEAIAFILRREGNMGSASH
jgi:hypothetical protein